MNIHTMRRVDKWAGIPICFILTLVRQLGRWLFPARSLPPIRRILILKLIEQGATVLAYPALQRAVKMVGRENVFFCVFEENRAIADIIDFIPPENILAIRTKNPVLLAFSLLQTIYRVRQLQIDSIVNFEFFTRAPAILAFLMGAKRRAGLHRYTAEGPYVGHLMTHRVQHNSHISTALSYDVLVEALELSPEAVPLPKVSLKDRAMTAPVFTPSAEDTARIDALLAQCPGWKPAYRLVILNPNAGDLMPIRKWPMENYSALGKRLLEQFPDIYLLVTGLPAEQTLAETVCREIGGDRIGCIAGKTTMRDLIALLCRTTILISNDSGPIHFAAMTPCTVIALYGPETPLLFGPMTENARILWAGLACSPCVSAFNHRFTPCKDNVCMQSITVDQVAEEAAGCLQR